MTDQQRVSLWEAVNEYASACGGDTSGKTISERRMSAVSAVERAVEAMIPKLAYPYCGGCGHRYLREQQIPQAQADEQAKSRRCTYCLEEEAEEVR
jgi:hypothetical protein